MKVFKAVGGWYTISELTKDQLTDIIGDMSVAEFESVESDTYLPLKNSVEALLGDSNDK